MKARQDQLLLARIGVDITHREDARRVGGESFGIDLELLALDLQSPLRDRPELGRQAEEHQQHVQRNHPGHTVGAGDLGAGQLAVFFFVADDLAHDELHLEGVAQLAHLRHRSRRGLEAVSAMDQDHALGSVGSIGREIQCPVERRIAAADDHQILAGEVGRALDPVMQLRAVELAQTVDLEQARLEGADAGRDEDGLGQELRAPGGLDEKAAVLLLFHSGDFLAEMERGAERLDLLEQVVGQFLASTHRHCGDVVDRLVGIELDALPTGIGERIDHMGLDLQKAEFEHLEQAHRAGADDHGIGFDRATFVCQGGFDHFLVQLRFHGAVFISAQFSESIRKACRSCLSSRRRRRALPCAW